MGILHFYGLVMDIIFTNQLKEIFENYEIFNEFNNDFDFSKNF